MNNWHAVWNKRELETDNSFNLETLIRLNGFDSGAGYVSVRSWNEAVLQVAQIIGIREGESVFEFGCGAGAYLYALAEQLNIFDGGGVDYSESLIRVARLALPKMAFECAEACKVQVHPKYDHVISHSMFQYFDLEYAEEVLCRMVAKARKTVAILDVPDAATRENAESIRRNKLSPTEYKKKYTGLVHNYYERAWFNLQAEKLGMTCQFIENKISDYSQREFRFGFVMRGSILKNEN